MSKAMMKCLVIFMTFMTFMGGILLFGLCDVSASSVGGTIVDKIHEPEHTYVYTYHNPTSHEDTTTSVHRDAKYTFVVADGDECYDISINAKTYEANHVGDEYYQSEEE